MTLKAPIHKELKDLVIKGCPTETNCHYCGREMENPIYDNILDLQNQGQWDDLTSAIYIKVVDSFKEAR
jgi:hypothetical protein